ncbi:actin-related protein 10 [Brevipalpus obovatus]|uniref:actin-related protein 10 n=1 Tax=Brevipalpus obovatus TaxID=246614 RepID=UPI003D9DD779
MMTDKNCVVIELGNQFTKIGFVHDPAPRAIVRTKFYSDKLGKEVYLMVDQRDCVDHNGGTLGDEELTNKLKLFIQNLYFQYLGINSKERRVVLVEPLFLSNKIKKILIDIFFNHLEVPSLAFVPSHLMSLVPCLISTGIVIDSGYTETLVIPIVDGETLLSSVQYARLGGQEINKCIREELFQRKAKIKIGSVEREFNESDDLSENIIENIKVKTCFVAPFERGQMMASFKSSVGPEPSECPPDVKFHLDGSKNLTIPGSLRESVAEILFKNYGEEQSVPSMVLDLLLSCPIDSRRTLASNIIVIGGTAMLPGFHHRLEEEMEYLKSTEARYSKLATIEFLFHKLLCKENYASWLGASIQGSLDAVNRASTNKESLQQSGGDSFEDWSGWWPKI